MLIKEKKANTENQDQSNDPNSEMDIMVTPSFKEINVKRVL